MNTHGLLPYLDLADPQFSTRGPEVMAAREASWCAQTPYGLAVLRHREVGQLLRDKRLRQGSHAWPDKHGLKGSFADFWQRSVIGQEGETHRLLRSLAGPVLTEQFVGNLVPQFETIAQDLVGNVTEQVEFQSAFAVPFAGQAICALLGLKRDDWPQISKDASDLGLAMGIDCKRYETRVNEATDRLMALSAELIAKVRDGRDQTSYIAELVARYDASGSDNMQALHDLIVISIFGGVDTTRSQLGLAMALFIDHPAQWQALRDDPRLAPAAVEEIIRARPTTTWSTREALVDFTYGEVDIKAGQTLHMLVHASAFDAAQNQPPDFDIRAKRKAHHGFGGGAHYCLGHLIARTDIAIALQALARRIEGIAYDGEAEWLPDSGNTSAVRLPLRFVLSGT